MANQILTKVDTAIVTLWGQVVGAVSWLNDRDYAVFEYEPAFLRQGLNISPIHMSLNAASQGDGKFIFPSLNKDTFLGLPGLLADMLPDKFGNRIIDTWLARNGRSSASFSPIERLCYTGKRGMGALEFSPAIVSKYDSAVTVDIAELVELAQEITNTRTKLDDANAIVDILRVGTSAGGARSKAVIAVNAVGNIISGQAKAPAEYDYWLLKFDGVSDLELGAPKGYGRIEYAYHLMAKAAGINMTECRLLEENGRAHFMTKRFDRVNGSKIHVQSLCGIAHYDFNLAGAYSYEQTFAVMRELRLSKADAVEQYRRMVFNIVARNLDDHTKNIAFLMDTNGIWQLSPAYDVTYAHNPAGKWTNQHQMSINGKRDKFTLVDLLQVADSISLAKPEVIINEVLAAVASWPEFARQAEIQQDIYLAIAKFHTIKFGIH